MFDLSLYNDDFFKWHETYTIEYQLKTFSWFIDKYKPTSVIDFGCGIGTYLKAAHDAGVTKLKGFDISDTAARYTPEEVKPFIEYKDCTSRINTDTYDCVLSFETAEHIDPYGTDQFINNIVRAASKHILFTAAPPGQDGCGHINMHEKKFWVDKFNLPVNEVLTKEVAEAWRAIGCPEYIHNNLIIFTK